MNKTAILFLFFALNLAYCAMYPDKCHAKTAQGVCRSPYIEVTRYLWQGNKWRHQRDADSKTVSIDDIVFEVSLDKEGVSITANGKELIYLDYREYYSDLKGKSKSRGKGPLSTVNGRRVMAKILNISPDIPKEGGVRNCLLQIYVESSKDSCDMAGWKFLRDFPVLQDRGNRLKQSHE